MENTLATLASTIEIVTGRPRFCNRGSCPKYHAQYNLSGRTHYADDATLRFFKSRIISSRVEREGLVLLVIESAAKNFRNTARGFRWVGFDLFGSVIRDPSERMHSRSASARKDADAWLQSFDVVSHYRTEIERLATQLDAQAAQIRSLDWT